MRNFRKITENLRKMPNEFETFDELQCAVADFIRERDWKQFHNPKNLAMALAVEAAELMELLQWLEADSAANLSRDEPLLGRLSEELADVLIYCASFANAIGVNLGEIAVNKIRLNEKKYPPEMSKKMISNLKGNVSTGEE